MWQALPAAGKTSLLKIGTLLLWFERNIQRKQIFLIHGVEQKDRNSPQQYNRLELSSIKQLHFHTKAPSEGLQTIPSLVEQQVYLCRFLLNKTMTEYNDASEWCLGSCLSLPRAGSGAFVHGCQLDLYGEVGYLPAHCTHGKQYPASLPSSQSVLLKSRGSRMQFACSDLRLKGLSVRARSQGLLPVGSLQHNAFLGTMGLAFSLWGKLQKDMLCCSG